MEDDRSGLVPREGMTIVGSDGETVGKIDVVETNYVIVSKGLFPQDYYIAVSDIVAEDEDGTLRLGIPAQEALDRGLGNPMAALRGEEHATDVDAMSLDATSLQDMAREDVGAGIDTARDDAPVVDDMPVDEPADAETAVQDVDAPDDVPAPDDEAHRRIELYEEELSVATRPVERGVVRVQKEIIEEKVTLEVPLVEDEVHVTRRRVDREIGDEDAAFEEDHIEIPLRGQDVAIEKPAHVVEEVEIHKSAHEGIMEVTETVRKERARVEGDDVIEITEDTSARPDEDETTTT